MKRGARIRIAKVTLKPGHTWPGKATFKIIAEGGPRRFTEAYFERLRPEVWVRRPEPV